MPTLLQSAFNTFQNYDIDIEKLTTNKFIQGYQTTLADLRGTVDWSLIDDTEAHKLATALGGKALGAGIEWFGDQAKAALEGAGTAIGVTGNPLAGAAMALMGIAVDAVLEQVAGAVEPEEVELRKGDWVVIDETGEFRRRIMGLEDLDAFNQEEMGHEKTPHRHSPHVHMGIYILGKGADVKVFDVQTGNIRTEPKNHIRRVPSKDQGELNENPMLRQLKISLEPSETMDQLKSETNTRVGDTVLYDGKKYTIHDISKDQVQIESNGTYRVVRWDQLQPALNDTTATPVDPSQPGSFASIPGGFNTGEWVYYNDPNVQGQYLLGVIQKCKGPKLALVVPALEGEETKWRYTVHMNVWKEQPAEKKLGKFRQAAINGDVQWQKVYRPSLDPNFKDMVTISGPGAKHKFKKQAAESFMTFAEGPSGQTAGFQGEVPVASQEDEAYDVRDQTGYTKPEATVKKEEDASNQGGLVLIGAACLVGVIIFMS